MSGQVFYCFKVISIYFVFAQWSLVCPQLKVVGTTAGKKCINIILRKDFIFSFKPSSIKGT